MLAYRQETADPVVWGNQGDFDTTDDWRRADLAYLDPLLPTWDLDSPTAASPS